MRVQLNPKLLLIIGAAQIAVGLGTILLLLQVDTVVNLTLYQYGLTFDYEWATPYWTFMRMALGLLWALVAVNGLVTVLHVLEIRSTPMVGQAVREPPVWPGKKTTQKRKQAADAEPAEDDGVEIVAIPMVCNKCGKVFTQPLCMFDFKSGKPRLVNVCPYCNTVLAVSGDFNKK